MGKVQRCQLILHEGRVEAGALMAAVGRHDREAPRQGGRITRGLGAEGRVHGPIQAATALEQKTPVPVIGKCQGKTQSIGLAPCSRPALERTLNQAISGDGDTERRPRR